MVNPQIIAKHEKLRMINHQFDRRLILSFLNSNFNKASKKNALEMQRILKNLVKDKHVLVHQSQPSTENLSKLYESEDTSLEFPATTRFAKSKDNIIFSIL